ncbi:MAG: substrate-binding domain-containing protein [Spirochaetes bacterium]|nr:substrate-binding domain-containing protein [Spirochaetota bacterium]
MKNKILTIAYITTGFYSGIRLNQYLGVLEGIRENKANLLCFSSTAISNSNVFEKKAGDIFELINSEIVDGILCSTNGLFQEEPYLNIENLLSKNRHIPFVCLGRSIKNFPSIIADDYVGSLKLMSHLIEVHNYKKIAYVRGPENYGNINFRFNGYIDSLKKYNIESDDKLISDYGNFDELTGKLAVEYFLDKLKLKPKKDIEAIVTVSDLISIGVIKELKRRNIRVPKDIAVAGFNNKEEGIEITPQMTSIDLQFSESGKMGISTLISIINKKQVPDIIYTPTKLVVRESCGCFHPAYVNEIRLSYSSGRIKNNGSNSNDHLKLKEPIIKQLNSFILKNNISFYKKEWTALLVNSLFNELLSKSENEFNETISFFGDECVVCDCSIIRMQEIISKLQMIFFKYIRDKDIISKADYIFHNARVLICQKLEQAYIRNNLNIFKQNEIFPLISSRIITAFDLKFLTSVIERELPNLGIKVCYLSLYSGVDNLTDKAEMILAYNEQGKINLEEFNFIYSSLDLVPNGLLLKDKRYEIIVLPLFFQDISLGYILFSVENIDAINYYIIRSYISSALEGALLVNDLKDRAQELKKAYDNLNENQKKLLMSEKMAALGRLTAGIAHEMNSPLASARNALEEIKHLIDEYKQSIDNPEVLPEDHRAISDDMFKYMDIAVKSIDKSTNFIKGIKSQTYNSFNVIQESFNGSKAISDYLDILQFLFKRNKCSLVKEIENNIMLCGDTQALNQILSNLIINAIDACKVTDNQESKIYVFFKKLDEFRAELQIKDNGIGISEENLFKIFDPFFTTKSLGEGTGLGLSIVHELVDKFKGYIEVKSKPSDTVFTIIFPLNNKN